MEQINRLFEITELQLKTNKDNVAFVSKYNGVWKKTTTEELYYQATNLSKGLLDLGVKKGDKIAVITDRNITEWHIIDLALLQIGVQSVPIYAATSIAEMKYIFKHAEITTCFVSNSLYEKVAGLITKIDSFKNIISFNPISKGLSIYEYIEIGKNLNTEHLIDVIKKKINIDDVATLIYTSGTTAMPKGVMLTHRNLLSASENAMATMPEDIVLDRALSLLPISHVFERLMLYMYQYRGVTIYFAESIQTVGDDMKIVKPHIMSIVPRLLEKIHDKILEKRDELSGIKKYIFNWALDVGYMYLPDKKNGNKYERKLARARKLVFKKWQDIFGGELNLIICGGSKLQPNISRVFNAAGLPIMEGYGLTEVSGVGSVNAHITGRNKIGTVGRTLDGVEIKIAIDGEVLMKGPIVMKGYYKDEFKTTKVFKDGFFKTGDLGTIDNDGFLTIIGRKKELFKTSGGKYISPIKIESLLLKSKLIEQAIVIGENERFPAVIIQINFDFFQKKHPNKTKRELAETQAIIINIQTEINRVNETLGQWEKIKKFELTPDEWTSESGHLTPTMKIKRDILKSKYYFLHNKIYR